MFLKLECILVIRNLFIFLRIFENMDKRFDKKFYSKIFCYFKR